MEIPKSLEDLILAHANVVEDAIMAFRAKDYPRAITLLNKAVDGDKQNWQVRFYLAMSYYSTGDVFTGAIHFRYLVEHCTDAGIREKSQAALNAMDKELKSPKKNNQR